MMVTKTCSTSDRCEAEDSVHSKSWPKQSIERKVLDETPINLASKTVQWILINFQRLPSLLSYRLISCYVSLETYQDSGTHLCLKNKKKLILM